MTTNIKKTTQKSAELIKIEEQIAVQSKDIRQFGQDIIRATAQTGLIYYDLIMYIRKNTVAPRLVTSELLATGFNKVRISEINKIAQSSDEVFAKFAAKTIGYHKVIDLARRELNESKENVPSAAATMLEKDETLTHAEVEAAVDSEEIHDPKTAKKKKKISAASHCKQGAALIFQYGDLKKNCLWENDLFTLTLTAKTKQP